MSTEISKCPLCQSNKMIYWGRTTGEITLHKTWSRCKNCLLVFANPCCDKNEINEFYKNEYYKVPEKQNFTETRLQLYHWLAHFADKYCKHIDDVLEIGCGRGKYLQYLCDQRPVKHVSGIEFDSKVTSSIQMPCSSQFYNDYFENITLDRCFDYIHCWHVIEHVVDVDAFLKKTHQCLKPNGIVIIGTPAYGLINNLKTMINKIFNRPLTVGTSSDHTYFFSKKTLKIFFDRNDFEIIHHTVYLDNINGELDTDSSLVHGIIMKICRIIMKITNIPLIGKQILIARRK